MNSNKQTPSIKLSVPKPCDKKYEDMQAVDGTCRFCTHCSTKVYDFTNCSQEEFLAIYEANNGKVCGRIKKNQSNYNPVPKQLFSSKPIWAKYLLSFLAFIGISLSSCNNQEQEHDVGTVENYTPQNEEVGKVEEIDSTQSSHNED